MACSSKSKTSDLKRANMEIDYEWPPKFCNCRRGGWKVKAPRWTSWTNKNPGRRFYGCPNYEVNGCNYFEWHDDAVSDRVKDLINQLKWKNRLLIIENNQLKTMGRGGLSNGEIGRELEEIWFELQNLKDCNMLETEKLKKRYKNVYLMAVISWILLLVSVWFSIVN